MTRVPENIISRYFHIGVSNLHLHKTAINCYVYLEKIHNSSASKDIPVETIEFKWEGYVLPNALVHPQSMRNFDAFWIDHKNPSQLYFNLFADSGRFFPRIKGPGIYELTYAVMSENFPTARATFVVKVGNKLEEITLKSASS